MAETLTVAQAAQTLDIPERTLRRWVTLGKVPSTPDPSGLRGRLIPADALEQLASLRHNDYHGRPEEEGSGRPLLASDRPMASVTGHGRPEGGRPDEPIPLNGATHTLSPDAATTRAEAAERERDRLAEEVRFLRAQVHLAQSAGEVTFLRDRLEQSHQAEEQLRILLGQAQRTIQEMAQRPALPPAPEETARPQRVRWWAPWRR